MALDAETVVRILRQYGREDHVMPSPREGHIRIVDINNDVTCAIENMGGIEMAANSLGVSTARINCWIDEYLVPEPFASLVKKRTGYFVRSLQEPTFYVYDGYQYWPHMRLQEVSDHQRDRRVYKSQSAAP